jgi:hypothetical protein
LVDDSRITTVAPPGAPQTEAVLGLTTALGDFDLGAVFLYRSPPVITRLVPPYGSSGATIQFDGEHIDETTEPRAVWFGDARSPNVYCGTGSCWVEVPPGTGTVPVRIETGGGTSLVTEATMFTYHPAPDVTGIEPASGPAAGGNTAVISGGNLADPLRVLMGEVEATVVSSTDTAITVTVPPGVPGRTVGIEVETRGGADGYGQFGLVYRYT